MARTAAAAAFTSDSTLMAAAVPVVCCFSICTQRRHSNCNSSYLLVTVVCLSWQPFIWL